MLSVVLLRLVRLAFVRSLLGRPCPCPLGLVRGTRPGLRLRGRPTGPPLFSEQYGGSGRQENHSAGGLGGQSILALGGLLVKPLTAIEEGKEKGL